MESEIIVGPSQNPHGSRSAPKASARMWPRRAWARCVAVVGLLLLVMAPAARADTNGLNREIFTGLTGSTLQNLTNDSNYPDHPFLVELATNNFEGPYNYGDHYGDRYRALLIPPLTGTYVFWVQGQNAAALSLSIDESPFDRTQIAVSTSTSFYRQYYAYPSQQSVSIVLQAGRRYYIEGIHSSGNGNDSFSAGWKLPNGIVEQPIPTSRLIPFGLPAVSPPSITAQPASVTLAENAVATFRVAVSNLDAVTYQWQRNGLNLAGVLGATYTLPAALTNDNGATFRCIVSNSFGAVISASAALTVVADATKPVLASAASINFTTVQVLFTEPVEPLTATNAANYSINNGISVLSAGFGASSREIILGTSPLISGSNYTVTVSSVRDMTAARNVILANSQRSFTALFKGVFREVYTGISGSLQLDLTNSPSFPNSPASAELITNLFETPDYEANNYGQRVRARILPPVTGNYVFWISAHDTATLFLGTNDQPSSARVIASVSPASLVCSREWAIQTNQQSVVIPLIAGQQYYIEALSKGGLSLQYPPDHLAVRWQLPDGSIEEPIQVSRLIPFGMTIPSVVSGPNGTNVFEGLPVTFAVNVSNPDPIVCQWQQNGTNLPGATNATYTIASTKISDNGATFRCILSNPLGTTNTPIATLSVVPETVRPALANVDNNSSNRVVVYFTELVDPATATNASNYAIPGIVISAPVLGADGRSVVLTTTPLTFGSNYTITVNRIRDRAATYNVIATNSQWVFAVTEFFLQEIGGSVRGSIANLPNGLNMTAGNGNFSGTNDSFSFGFEQRRGDFDVKVRVARLDFADAWTTAGLMAREDLGTNSRYTAVLSTPSVAGTFFQSRADVGGVPVSSGAFPVNYPYTWLRLQK
ncbi:MAG: large repetitive protein, partial [Verrucomicrobiota bacterium]